MEIKNEFAKVVPDRDLTLQNLKSILKTGYTKDFTILEMIQAAGLLTELAGVWYYSEECPNEARKDSFETCMKTVSDLITDQGHEKLRNSLTEEFLDKMTEAYIKRIQKAQQPDDDEDEYDDIRPVMDEDGNVYYPKPEEDEDFVGEYPMP